MEDRSSLPALGGARGDQGRIMTKREFMDGHYLIQPDFRFFKRRFKNKKVKPVPEDFEYSSGNISWWLTVYSRRIEEDDIKYVSKMFKTKGEVNAINERKNRNCYFSS